MVDSVGLNPQKGQFSNSVGYVYIPKGVDRDNFVETCMRKGICSIYRENSFGIINNVQVESDLIQKINWPKETGKLGQGVLIITDSFKKQNYIVALLNKNGEILQCKEGQRIIQKTTENGTVTICLDANLMKIDIFSEGEINIVTRGGDVNIRSDETVNIESSERVNINCDSIVHNNGEEPILRGQKTVDLLETLIDLLFQARVATSIGLQPLTNFVEINELKTRLNELKSEKSFIK